MGSFSEADPGLEGRDLMSADGVPGLTERLLAALTLVAVNNFFPIQV
jgi:hypothetical protein